MHRASVSYDTDVLVVGAGPTGLMLACELAARGVRVRLLEKSQTRSDKSRALVMQARSLELLQKLGLADALVSRGRRAMHVRAYARGTLALDAEIGDIGAEDTPFPFLLFVSQAETERLLEGRLEAFGGRAERATELTGFDQSPDGVVAHVRSGEERSTVRARFLVGCDGAHSVVRKGAGLTFEGGAYESDFVLADAELTWDAPADTLHLFFNAHGLLAALPLRDAPFYRLIASRRVRASSEVGEPTLGDVRAFVDDVVPFPVLVSRPRWLTRFRLHHRGVNRYRVGRVFVAGDAAHIHSPVGGQGMNTGLQDANNLAWKLALVIGGRAPERLLDSYEAERMPVGKQLLRVTDRLFSLAASRNPLVLLARDAMARLLGPRALRDASRRKRAFRFISQLGVRYLESPAVAEDFAGATEAFRRGPGAGTRAPDAPMRLGPSGAQTSLFAQLMGTTHHVLVFARADDELEAVARDVRDALGARADLVDIHTVARAPRPGGERLVDQQNVAHTRYGADEGGVYLLRPDGYIAFRAPRVNEALRSFLARTFA